MVRTCLSQFQSDCSIHMDLNNSIGSFRRRLQLIRFIDLHHNSLTLHIIIPSTFHVLTTKGLVDHLFTSTSNQVPVCNQGTSRNISLPNTNAPGELPNAVDTAALKACCAVDNASSTNLLALVTSSGGVVCTSVRKIFPTV